MHIIRTKNVFDMKHLQLVRKVQQDILSTYERDFSKHAPSETFLK